MQKIAIISFVCLVVGISVSNGYVANNNEEIDEEIKNLVRALADTKENGEDVVARQESDDVEQFCSNVCDDDDCEADCVACIGNCGEDDDCVASCFEDDEDDGGIGDGSIGKRWLRKKPRIPWRPIGNFVKTKVQRIRKWWPGKKTFTWKT